VNVNSVTRTLAAAAISGTKVVLFLSSAVVHGDAITVSYVRPDINPIQSVIGEQAGSFAAQSVVNNVNPGVPVYVDQDNNTFSVIGIGFQIWMKENLKTTKYGDGTSISNVTDNAAWADLTSELIAGIIMMSTIKLPMEHYITGMQWIQQLTEAKIYALQAGMYLPMTNGQL
jgi:nucleoside-diphosphate-sugar epimerase